MDIILRGSKLVDKLYVAPAFNVSKNFIFTLEERKEHLEKIFQKCDNIQVVTFSNLLSDYVAKNKITYIIKGVRNSIDFEHEYTMAQINRKLNDTCETLFIPSSPELSYISSSLVKEIYYNNGKLNKFVPKEMLDFINTKKGKKTNE